ncbi:MAG: hypothetical protein FD135_1473 [Comamonadaceae bacterium]|nr:MAG: hypothetical protein FD135_1473 [Comamonadaceae bacterium]
MGTSTHTDGMVDPESCIFAQEISASDVGVLHPGMGSCFDFYQNYVTTYLKFLCSS